MNCFAGGVFLAMALIHILPEAAETYNEGMSQYLTRTADNDMSKDSYMNQSANGNATS